MLEFDTKTHTYTLEGKEIPSVSELLRFCHREVYEEPDKFLMDQAADRGTRVHLATQALDETGECEADPDIAGYVEAYTKFLKEHEVEWEAIEYMVNCEDIYAGTIDRVGILDGKPTLLDIKTTSKITGKHKIMYGAQLTAYAWALADYCGHNKLIILHLKKDGTYKLIELKQENDVLNSCLSLHQAFEKTKRRKKSNG